MRFKPARLLLATAIVCLGCGAEQGPMAPVATVPDCQRNGTADLAFRNEATHTTYDLVLDASRPFQLAPGHGLVLTLPAGPHDVRVLFATTAQEACPGKAVNVAQCSVLSIACSADS